MKVKLCWKYLFMKWKDGDVNLVRANISSGFFFDA